MSALAIARPRAEARSAPSVGPRHRQAPTSPTGRVRLVVALATIGIAAGALFAAVALNAAAAQASVDARRLEAEVRSAERAHAELLVDVAELEDPARIRARAIAMGLVPAPAARHLLLRRAILADGAPDPSGTVLADPLKPVLTQER